MTNLYKSLNEGFNATYGIDSNIDEDMHAEYNKLHIIGAIHEHLAKINEAEMSDEDKADTEVLRGIYDKLQKRKNAALTQDEKNILNKYDLINRDGTLYNKDNIYNGDGLANYFTNQRNGQVKPEVNLADRARKLKDRPQRYSTSLDSYGGDSYYSDKYDILNRERVDQDIKMQKPVKQMKQALLDRRISQGNLDDSDADFEAKVAELKRTKDATDRYYKNRVKDNNNIINNLLKRNKNEALDLANESDFDIAENLKSDVYDALEEIAYKYKKYNLDQDDFELAIEWFTTHFFDL